ncbi:hypothetical protein [Chryseobacterium indologenes]|uniref:hypothetical protein n=1 Tax=Chryseobacterium indologenes TaxID=253 RepID=UPI003D346DAE
MATLFDNFEVEGNHNYYVSEKGILVHNNCEWTSAITNTLENASSGVVGELAGLGRPRDGSVIPMCDNCKTTFNK